MMAITSRFEAEPAHTEAEAQSVPGPLRTFIKTHPLLASSPELTSCERDLRCSASLESWCFLQQRS